MFWQVSDADADCIWEVLGSPSAIVEAAETRLYEIPNDVEKYCTELNLEKSAFFSSIEDLKVQVSIWNEFCTEESCEFMVEGVKNLMERLQVGVHCTVPAIFLCECSY